MRWCVYGCTSYVRFIRTFHKPSKPLCHDAMWIKFKSKQTHKNLEMPLPTHKVFARRFVVSVVRAIPALCTPTNSTPAHTPTPKHNRGGNDCVGGGSNSRCQTPQRRKTSKHYCHFSNIHKMTLAAYSWVQALKLHLWFSALFFVSISIAPL